jgi:hypothetical protein
MTSLQTLAAPRSLDQSGERAIIEIWLAVFDLGSVAWRGRGELPVFSFRTSGES